MGQNLMLGLPIPVALAMLALFLILLALARLLLSLCKPAPLRQPSQGAAQAPYKIETLPAARIDVVPHAGREPANR